MNTNSLENLLTQLKKLDPKDGIQPTLIDQLYTFSMSDPYELMPQVYEPSIGFILQGEKVAFVKDKNLKIAAGHLLTVFISTPVECGLVKASPEEPFLGINLTLDRDRISAILLKMQYTYSNHQQLSKSDITSIFSAPIEENLTDPLLRLMKVANNPLEAKVLGDSIIDEIYFRIIMNYRNGILSSLLAQNGQITQISKVVEHIHTHLEDPINVDGLADIINLSTSNFHKKFKEVMHISPHQYIKSIRLSRAQSYLLEGQTVSQACYKVGYNSPTQFSREFKRHFGIKPSSLRVSS